MLTVDINTKKNLLAFSSGIDSTALFFILLENNIPFDLAIVNYNQREQSKEEVEYAKALAQTHHKKCFIKEVTLTSTSNFEKNARDIRYNFFESLICKHGYETLLTAHQLDDQLEWFLMQLTKGAGLKELLGLNALTKKEGYTLLRPLLSCSKEELKTFLDQKEIHYFIDETNHDESYTRNHFRKHYSQQLIASYKNGIQNSLTYLQRDLASLDIPTIPLIKKKSLEVFENLQDDNKNIRIIDQSLKQRGLLISKAQRDEIFKQKEITLNDSIFYFNLK